MLDMMYTFFLMNYEYMGNIVGMYNCMIYNMYIHCVPVEKQRMKFERFSLNAYFKRFFEPNFKDKYYILNRNV